MSGLALWLTQRLTLARAGTGTTASLEFPLVLEQVLALDPRRRLCLVRCGGNRLLLLTGGGQDLSLGWVPAEPAA